MKNIWDYPLKTTAIVVTALTIALTGCVRQPVVQSRDNVGPGVSQSIVTQPRPLPTSLVQKKDTADWKTYHNEQYKFSFRHPANWKLTKVADFKDDLVFLNTKPENNFAPGTVMLRIKIGADVGKLDALGWLKKNYPGDYHEIETRRINGILWYAYAPSGSGIFPQAPLYPFMIAKIGDVIYLFEPGYASKVSNELEDILYSARFGSWFVSQLAPFKRHGSPIDTSTWQSTEFQEFGLTFRYPAELPPLNFLLTTSSNPFVHGTIYFGGWSGEKITFSLFSDNYGFEYAEGSQPYFYPFNFDNPEEIFWALSQGYNFFALSVFEIPGLNNKKALRASEARGYGDYANLAVTYFVPHIGQNLNLYVIVDLNDQVDVTETRGGEFFTAEEFEKLLLTPEVLKRVATAEEIVRNISSIEMVQ